MGNKSVELAKTVCMECCEQTGAMVTRTKVTVYEGWGLVLRATLKEYQAWLALMQQSGLEPEMHDYNITTESKMEPIYLYEVFVHVDANWKPR